MIEEDGIEDGTEEDEKPLKFGKGFDPEDIEQDDHEFLSAMFDGEVIDEDKDNELNFGDV